MLLPLPLLPQSKELAAVLGRLCLAEKMRLEMQIFFFGDGSSLTAYFWVLFLLSVSMCSTAYTKSALDKGVPKSLFPQWRASELHLKDINVRVLYALYIIANTCSF